MGERIFTAGGPSYKEVKDKLFDQFVHPCYENNAGMSGEALEKGFRELAENKGKLTRQELRAVLFCYVTEHARVGVDPKDSSSATGKTGGRNMERDRCMRRRNF